MKNKIVNEGGINGSGKGFVDTNSEDFKILQAKIKEHYAALSPEQKRKNILFSYRLQLGDYKIDKSNIEK